MYAIQYMKCSGFITRKPAIWHCFDGLRWLAESNGSMVTKRKYFFFHFSKRHFEKQANCNQSHFNRNVKRKINEHKMKTQSHFFWTKHNT